MIKKMIIITASIAVVIFIAFTLVLWLFGGELFFMAPSYNKMDRFLKTNFTELSYVTNALFELDYDSVEITKIPLREVDKYNMKVGKDRVYETIPIPDDLVVHIEILYKRGVNDISCGRGSVDFSVWAFMDEIRGITYSKTGLTLEDGQYIEVRQLSKENWFYYVNNFEKWKARNPQLFP